MASQVDAVFLYLTAVSALLTAAIFIVILVFAVKYRRRTPDQLAKQVQSSVALELLWISGPLVIVISFFILGAMIFFKHSTPAAAATEIYVVGKQWMWYIQHPEGRREINSMHVPAGRPFKLVMTSEDVIHSFFVPAFRVKQDVIPGRYTQLWFQPTRVGSYHLFCTEYCGTNHSRMVGWIHVLAPTDYETWLQGGVTAPTMAAAGEQLFQSLGCNGCHGTVAPALHDVYGSRVQFADGSSTIADEAYIRESILDPSARIVAGYRPIMPTFRGQVDEQGLLQLIAYIRSLAAAPRGQPAGGQAMQPPAQERGAGAGIRGAGSGAGQTPPAGAAAQEGKR